MPDKTYINNILALQGVSGLATSEIVEGFGGVLESPHAVKNAMEMHKQDGYSPVEVLKAYSGILTQFPHLVRCEGRYIALSKEQYDEYIVKGKRIGKSLKNRHLCEILNDTGLDVGIIQEEGLPMMITLEEPVTSSSVDERVFSQVSLRPRRSVSLERTKIPDLRSRLYGEHPRDTPEEGSHYISHLISKE